MVSVARSTRANSSALWSSTAVPALIRTEKEVDRNSRLQSRFDQSSRYTVNSFDFSTGHIGKHANAVLSANRNCCSGARDAYELMTVEGTVWRIARVYRQTLAKAALHDLR